VTKRTDVEWVAEQIPDGSTLAFPGNLTIMVVDDLLKAVEERFLRTGRPCSLTVFEPCNATLGPGTGIERLAHPGLLRRLICAAFPTFKGSRLAELIQNDRIEAYNFPMGVLYSLTREIGAGRPGLFTEVGLDTFVDPAQSGGKLNACTTEDMVERHVVGGRDLLFYKAFPIDVVFLKATTADEVGNLSIENEPLSLGALSLAIAAKASGGKVFAQVERIVSSGAILPKSVLVPGVFVDRIVLAPDAPQSGMSRFDPTITGQSRAELARTPLPAGPARIILARAAAMLRSGWLVNLGVGIPAQLPSLLRESRLENEVTFSTEHGAIGGVPCSPLAFGAHANPLALLDPTDTFNFYAGGVLDITLLGLAQADEAGNVNVSRFGGRMMGVGGFIDITARTRRIVICGSLAADGPVIEVLDGRVVVTSEGRMKKLVRQVEQITLNGRRCLSKGQEVTMITERGVFALTDGGWLLIEVAPGIDPDRHIAPMLDFPLRVAPDARAIDRTIMTGPGPAFDKWLRDSLAGAIAERRRTL
jgi:propionate CoA-transferase